MTQLRSLRLAVPATLLSLALGATPALAFQPSVLVIPYPDSQTGNVTDLAARGAAVAFTTDILVGGQRQIGLAASTDGGATWPIKDWATTGPTTHVESAAAVCAGEAVAIYAEVHPLAYPTARVIRGATHELGTAIKGGRFWSTSGIARYPEAACVANAELAVAWFQQTDSGYAVKLRTGVPVGDDLTPQTFTLGSGTPSRGLSIAATADRVFVTWFQGSALKLRRFGIGSTSAHTLTSLGTATIASLTDGAYPEVGADGSRVVIAYMHQADLKVRRSTDKGISFGSAIKLRDEPYPSEIGASPTTVAVKGSLVVIGANEIAGDPGGLSGRGLGYKSTNGGSSYTKISSHAGGRLLAAIVRPGSTNRYAEVWDHSLDSPSPGDVRYRRE
jgi:hypothetical protein